MVSLDPPGGSFLQAVLKGLQVELVLQALTPGFDDDGKIGKMRNCLEKPLRPKAGLPKWSSLVETWAGKKESPARPFAEPGTKEARGFQAASEKAF
jgi:hypothetical protein